MMSFEEPAYLCLAVALPVLAAGYWLRRRAALRTGEPLQGRSRTGVRLRQGLRLLALGTLVVALGKPLPQTPAQTPEPAQGPRRVVFLVDVSTSMLAADVLPDRLTQAKKVVAEAVRGLPGQEVGVVVFAGNAQVFLPLTTDYEVVSRACATITPGLVPRQGTSLVEALTLAALVLKPTPQHRQVACVLSDGENHTPRFEALADSLSKAGMDIFAIGVGTPEGAAMFVKNSAGGEPTVKRDRQGQPILSRFQEASLQRIAQGRPERYLRLDNWRSTTARLLQALHNLNPGTNQLQSAGPAEYFQWFLLAAFILLLVEFLVPLFHRIPS
ncbi:VWA domain-containing protein [Hymenobacter sp. 5317J-9]|uniref:vWA domain-containing protein n=1 Tax=Hymenobacter sp. 5317J-9 TaxID=2932250 RepID=UPI001FD71F7B|nr:VWA domain-containing protein [Hymenobacter sp. 5317J-9]UOQ96708.1 VWA domain-containing protein [Hymenobacter sp. 5317J-9]